MKMPYDEKGQIMGVTSLTPKELAAEFQIELSEVEDMIAHGGGPRFFRTKRGEIRFLIAEIQTWTLKNSLSRLLDRANSKGGSGDNIIDFPGCNSIRKPKPKRKRLKPSKAEKFRQDMERIKSSDDY